MIQGACGCITTVCLTAAAAAASTAARHRPCTTAHAASLPAALHPPQRQGVLPPRRRLVCAGAPEGRGARLPGRHPAGAQRPRPAAQGACAWAGGTWRLGGWASEALQLQAGREGTWEHGADAGFAPSRPCMPHPPTHPTARQLAEAEKEQKRIAFERALATPDEPTVSEQVPGGRCRGRSWAAPRGPRLPRTRQPPSLECAVPACTHACALHPNPALAPRWCWRTSMWSLSTRGRAWRVRCA